MNMTILAGRAAKGRKLQSIIPIVSCERVGMWVGGGRVLSDNIRWIIYHTFICATYIVVE